MAAAGFVAANLQYHHLDGCLRVRSDGTAICGFGVALLPLMPKVVEGTWVKVVVIFPPMLMR